MKGWRIAIVVLLIAILIEFSMLQSPRQEEAWEPPQQQEETLETSQDSWQQVQQQEIPEPTQEQEEVESAENQTEDHIESNTDYASYLVMTASPHVIVDSNGFRYIVGGFKNTSSVEFDSVYVLFALYDKDGNRIDDTLALIHNLLPGKTWKYKEMITNKEASYFEFAEINVYIDEK